MLGNRFTWTFVAVLFLARPTLANDDSLAANRFEPRSGDVLIFLCDEVAEQAEFSQFLESFLLTRFPDREFRTFRADLPRDLSAGETPQVLRDVATHRPTAVIVFPGMIDTGDAGHREASFQAFRRKLQELHRFIRDMSAEPIYLSPLMFDSRAARQSAAIANSAGSSDPNATLAYYALWLREFAAESSARFVDLHGSLNRWTHEFLTRDASFTFFSDGRRPTPTGHLAIATTIFEQWGHAKPLSSIQIECNGDDLSVIAEGGQILNFHMESAEIMSFLWMADSLPWMLPPEFHSSAELLDTSERFNHETLRIDGLSQGSYQLLIDDRLIGRFSSADFQAGISLHELGTPQAEQAKAIAVANLERTESYFRPARRLRKLIAEQEQVLGDLADLSGSIASADRQKTTVHSLAELRGELQKLDAADEDAWNRLQADVQPMPRQFVIRPVPTAQVQGRVFVAGMPISGASIELHGMQGLSAAGTTDAMGFFELTTKTPDEISPGEAWLVVLAQMVLPKFVSLESSGHRVMLRAGVNEIEFHFEETLPGE